MVTEAQSTIIESKEQINDKNSYGDLLNLNTMSEQNVPTYFKVGDEADGFFEIDLVNYRQKGAETRYLSLNIIGFDISQNPPVPQNAVMTISNKEEFEKLKAFFAQLNWEA